jgi:hypothetical protein
MFAADQVRDSEAAIWSSRSNLANRDVRVARGCSKAGQKRGTNNCNYNYKKVGLTCLTATEGQPPATRSNGWLREYPRNLPLQSQFSLARLAPRSASLRLKLAIVGRVSADNAIFLAAPIYVVRFCLRSSPSADHLFRVLVGTIF